MHCCTAFLDIDRLDKSIILFFVNKVVDGRFIMTLWRQALGRPYRLLADGRTRIAEKHDDKRFSVRTRCLVCDWLMLLCCSCLCVRGRFHKNLERTFRFWLGDRSVTRPRCCKRRRRKKQGMREVMPKAKKNL